MPVQFWKVIQCQDKIQKRKEKRPTIQIPPPGWQWGRPASVAPGPALGCKLLGPICTRSEGYDQAANCSEFRSRPALGWGRLQPMGASRHSRGGQPGHPLPTGPLSPQALDVARPERAAHPPCARGGPCRAPSRPGPGTTSGRTCLVRTCPASSVARPRSGGAARGDGVRARGGREEEMSSAPRIPTSLLGSPRPGPSSAAGAGAAGAVGSPGHRAALIGPKFVAPAGSLKPQALEPAVPR